MVTEAAKNFIEQYLTLTIWFHVYQGDKNISTKQFGVVLQEVGRVKDGLRSGGVSETALQKLNDYSEQLYRISIDQLSPNAQLKICKIIFGGGARWEK